MNKPTRYPWLHKMTDEERKRYRCRLLNADFEHQERVAADEARENDIRELADSDDHDSEDSYGPINRF